MLLKYRWLVLFFPLCVLSADFKEDDFSTKISTSIKRQEMFSTWMKNLRVLRDANKESVPEIVEIEEYLSNGTLIRPSKDELFQPLSYTPKVSHPLILVLFSKDKYTNPILRKLYKEPSSGAYATFYQSDQLIVMRTENVSDQFSAAALAHEGFHALSHEKRKRTTQSDHDHCMEEARASEIEFSLIMGSNRQFKEHVLAEVRKNHKTLFDETGKLKRGLIPDISSLNTIFGAPRSDFDSLFQIEHFARAVLFLSILDDSGNDRQRTLERFSKFMCKKHRK